MTASAGSSAPPAVRLVGRGRPTGPAPVRMDVAAFVGRVASGALAAVEGPEAFAEGFAEAAGSRLGPAVRAFFRNGGRRCWVVPVPPADPLDPSADRFVDPELEFAGVGTLAREAAGLGRPPRGVHAVLALDEVTLLAVPDAFPPEPAPPAVAEPGTPDADETKPAVAAGFRTCRPPVAAALGLLLTVEAGTRPGDPPAGWRRASWDWADADPKLAAARADAVFVLQHAAGRADEVYRGSARAVLLRPEGLGRYRVRAEAGGRVGPWAVAALPAASAGVPTAGYEDPLAIQAAAVKACAARGDVLAVLTPPREWPDGPAGRWLHDLRGHARMGFDADALRTHAAAWGPWVWARDGDGSDAEPEAYPGAGAVCGLLARWAVDRGAWASVLNVPVEGAVGLGPRVADPGPLVPLFAAEPPVASRVAVAAAQAAGVNLLGRTPRGFVPLGERTAWPDPVQGGEVGPEPVPVRRLMALLRRELERLGADLAFAPNGPALERRAARAVEAVLERLLRAGALVGPDARSAFQVTARAGAGAEERFEVEVRVRPAPPLRELTLRLVRSGDGAFAVAKGEG